MDKQVKTIAVLVLFDIDTRTGREFVESASVIFRDKRYEAIREIGLGYVVHTERDLWKQVQKATKHMIDEGYDIDRPRVRVFRTHRLCLEVDYYAAIGADL
jgi:hypothetical protein